MLSATSAQTSLVLASSSPRRQELISMLGLPVRIMPSGADEHTPENWSPREIVEELSMRKAIAVKQELTQSPGESSIIVGSDTIVVLNGQVMGKPADEQDAERMLRQLAGNIHEVYTGVCCVRSSGGSAGTSVRAHEIDGLGAATSLGSIGEYRVVSESLDGQPELIVGYTLSKVAFRAMSEDEIRAYVRTGDPLDKAGSYGIQGLGAVFIEKIEGDFYSVMGLP